MIVGNTGEVGRGMQGNNIMPIVPLLSARYADVDTVKAMTCKKLAEWLSKDLYKDEAYKEDLKKLKSIEYVISVEWNGEWWV